MVHGTGLLLVWYLDLVRHKFDLVRVSYDTAVIVSRYKSKLI